MCNVVLHAFARGMCDYVTSLVFYLGRLALICMVVLKRCCIVPAMAILSIAQSMQFVTLSQLGSAVV